MAEAEILFEVKDGLGIITLNRPKALNSLSHGMILEMEKVLPQWETDPAIKAVVLRGAGDRAFCAGGDVAGLYREMRDNPSGTLRRDFFRDEYIVNRRIYRFAKPCVSAAFLRSRLQPVASSGSHQPSSALACSSVEAPGHARA